MSDFHYALGARDGYDRAHKPMVGAMIAAALGWVLFLGTLIYIQRQPDCLIRGLVQPVQAVELKAVR